MSKQIEITTVVKISPKMNIATQPSSPYPNQSSLGIISSLFRRDQPEVKELLILTKTCFWGQGRANSAEFHIIRQYSHRTTYMDKLSEIWIRLLKFTLENGLDAGTTKTSSFEVCLFCFGISLYDFQIKANYANREHNPNHKLERTANGQNSEGL